MNAPVVAPWWDRVPFETVERFVNLVERQRRLGRVQRVLLLYGQRLELDLVEQQLDELLAEVGPAIAAASAELRGEPAAAEKGGA